MTKPQAPKGGSTMPSHYLYFGSKMKANVQKFSNFFKVEGGVRITWSMTDCPCEFLRDRTCVYPSTEHAYQALKALNLYSAKQFEVGGLFSSFDIFEKWPTDKIINRLKRLELKKDGSDKQILLGAEMLDYMQNIKTKKEKVWGNGSLIGIIAKLAASLPSALSFHMWGVRLLKKTHISLDVWPAILQAKYRPGTPLAHALLKTEGAHLVEFDKKTYTQYPKKSFYGAKWVESEKKMRGDNEMGKLLMECRRWLICHPKQ
jgi:hypothetical protein